MMQVYNDEYQEKILANTLSLVKDHVKKNKESIIINSEYSVVLQMNPEQRFKTYIPVSQKSIALKDLHNLELMHYNDMLGCFDRNFRKANICIFTANRLKYHFLFVCYPVLFYLTKVEKKNLKDKINGRIDKLHNTTFYFE